MLPRPARLHDSADFRRVTRRGVRAGRPTLVVHAAPSSSTVGPSRAGFVVSRAVGDAVTRNRVKRRLRHLVADRLRVDPLISQTVPGGAVDYVVRALPAAVTTPDRLAADLGSAWSKVSARLTPGAALVQS